MRKKMATVSAKVFIPGPDPVAGPARELTDAEMDKLADLLSQKGVAVVTRESGVYAAAVTKAALGLKCSRGTISLLQRYLNQ